MSLVVRKPAFIICEQRRRSAWHPRSLISAFVVRCLDSIISLVYISHISRLQLASVAEQAGLCLTWSETPKTGFLATRLIYASKWRLKNQIAMKSAHGQSDKVDKKATENLIQPPHYKANKVACAPREDSASAQSDRSLRCVHMPFCWFCHDPAHINVTLFS